MIIVRTTSRSMTIRKYDEYSGCYNYTVLLLLESRSMTIRRKYKYTDCGRHVCYRRQFLSSLFFRIFFSLCCRKSQLLAGSNIYITEDFSKRVKDRRMELQKFMKKLKRRWVRFLTIHKAFRSFCRCYITNDNTVNFINLEKSYYPWKFKWPEKTGTIHFRPLFF